MIEIRDLTVRYGKKIAVENLSLKVKDGERVILMGPNGSGKTTLLRALLGLVKFEGRIFLNGREVGALSRTEIAREISYVPQIFSTPYAFTVKDFVSMGLYSHSREWWHEDRRVNDAIEMVGITNLTLKEINTLSGGELQKAIIARALVQDASYILMDEPTAHLDIRSVQEVLDIISNLKNKGIIMVSHDLNALNKIGGTVILMKNGKLIFRGTKEDSDLKRWISETFETNIREIDDFLYFPLT